VLALATALLTLLGAAGEGLGFDRGLRANTVKRRTHSLFRQGREYIAGAIGRLADAARRLLESFRASLLASLMCALSLGKSEGMPQVRGSCLRTAVFPTVFR
jgi:hypothetical protein